MNFKDYLPFISKETTMGPNSVRILEELLTKYPLMLKPEDTILDLGCGKGLTSLVVTKETGAKVVADDLWISEEENRTRFQSWGILGQVTPVWGDANDLPFQEKQFQAMISVDSYHYFGGEPGFFQEKIVRFLDDGAVVLIGIPGIQQRYAGRSEELLAAWLGEEAYMFKSAEDWKNIMGCHGRIASVETWEMDCFEDAWMEWFATEHPFAQGDKGFYQDLIQPYTCFVGIKIQLK